MFEDSITYCIIIIKSTLYHKHKNSKMKKILSIIALSVIALASLLWIVCTSGLIWFCGLLPLFASVFKLSEILSRTLP